MQIIVQDLKGNKTVVEFTGRTHVRNSSIYKTIDNAIRSRSTKKGELILQGIKNNDEITDLNSITF